MFGSKQRAAQIDEIEARGRGLVKLYEQLEAQQNATHETHTRLASAIDELEARINNNQITVNAAFGGLSRRVGSIAQDTLDAVEAIKQQIAVVPSAAVPPSVPPASQGPTDGGLTLTAYEQAALDDYADGRSDAPMTSSADMDALMVHGLTAPIPASGGSVSFGKARATVHEDAALDRARADR